MSDCSTNAYKPYDVARLRIEFGGEEPPWKYPLALNGRVIGGVFVDGERYERVRECEKLPQISDAVCVVRRNGFEMQFGYWRCSECGCENFEGAKHCMNCGARVKEGGDD